MSKALFDIKQGLYFGVVYIPPESSKYFKEDGFYELEQPILHTLSLSYCAVLMVDFNSKTRHLCV